VRPANVTELETQTMRRLMDAGQALVAHLDLERVLEDLLGIAIEVTGAQYAAIGVLDSDRIHLARFLTRGVDPETHAAIGDLPRGRGVLGVLITEPRPLRLADVGTHPRSYGFPSGHPVMRSFLGVPITIRGEAWGNLYLTEKAEGAEFSTADEEAAIALASWSAIAIENARLYEDAHARRQDLERAVLRLEATTAIARAVGTETDLNRVLDLIGKRARALVEARSLLLLLAEGDGLIVAAAAGQVDARAVGTRIPTATSTLGGILAQGRTERIGDLATRFGLEDESLGVIGAETALLVPLIYRGTSIGVLAAFDRMEGQPGFRDDDETLLEGFAATAATAVATAQGVERERLRHSLRAAEAERRRWARELHDETLQSLAGLRLLLSSGLRSDDPQASVDASREAVDQLSQEIENLRRLITELRPAALDDLGLGPAIESLVERAATTQGLETALTLELGDDRLPLELETAVYRVVQEALGNAVRHAGATRVAIRVERTFTSVEMEVTDDGGGFDPAQVTSGFGIVGMHERAALADGRLDVDSSPDGTSVRGSFPLPAATR
jgi:signal transduction histidine kinase